MARPPKRSRRADEAPNPFSSVKRTAHTEQEDILGDNWLKKKEVRAATLQNKAANGPNVTKLPL